MLHARTLVIVASTIALSTAAPALADPLTVEQVVSLSIAGVGDDAIVAKIRSSGSRFDLSPEQMVALKGRGVSGPVIAAMLGGVGGAGAVALSLDSPDPAIPHASGVYMLSADATKMTRIEPTASSQAKTGGIWGYALTGGIASMSMKATIANSTAPTKSMTTSPVFYFFLEEPNAQGQSGAPWFPGSLLYGASPNQFTLVHLDQKKGRREARVGQFNIGGSKMGVMDKDQIGFRFVLVRPGVYRIAVSAPLAKGEYGFLYSNAGGAGGAMAARIFDFSIP